MIIGTFSNENLENEIFSHFHFVKVDEEYAGNAHILCDKEKCAFQHQLLENCPTDNYRPTGQGVTLYKLT